MREKENEKKKLEEILTIFCPFFQFNSFTERTKQISFFFNFSFFFLFFLVFLIRFVCYFCCYSREFGEYKRKCDYFCVNLRPTDGNNDAIIVLEEPSSNCTHCWVIKSEEIFFPLVLCFYKNSSKKEKSSSKLFFSYCFSLLLFSFCLPISSLFLLFFLFSFLFCSLLFLRVIFR